jgi:hypothetical protein
MAVVPVEAKGVDDTTASVVNDTLLQALHEIGEYSVLGKSDIERLVGFQGMRQLLGCSDINCTASIGNTVGADLLLTPTIGQLDKTSVVTLRILDVKKVTITGSEQQRADTAGINWVQLVRRAAYALFNKKPPEDMAAETAKADAQKQVQDNYAGERRSWIVKMSTMFGLAVVMGVTSGVLFAIRPTEKSIHDNEYQTYLAATPANQNYANVSGAVTKGNIMLGAAYGTVALAVVFAAVGIGVAANAPEKPAGVSFSVSPQGAYFAFDTRF